MMTLLGWFEQEGAELVSGVVDKRSDLLLCQIELPVRDGCYLT